MNVYPTDEQAREAILEIGRRMYAKNYVAANDGNISCKVADGIWATPTGVSKGFMQKDELVKLRLDGSVLQAGPRNVSSEIKMHLRVYNENSTVGGVTHAHPPYCTAFAVAGLSLDRAVYPEALVNLGVVPCVHYETPGSQGIPDSIAPYCTTHNAVLLANHGALSWAKTVVEAFYRLESMEHYAHILIITGKILGHARLLTSKQIDDLLEIRKKLGVTTGGCPGETAGHGAGSGDVLGTPDEVFSPPATAADMARLYAALERIEKRMTD
ncbi:MAG: class II aldolase/adducin family protein [Spirochaetaceae bacterium]|jgi:L-fuculose-phosphate aldolase|nr:class II aldolase/adducin family protein [Spirochaetaceae bacterium]